MATKVYVSTLTAVPVGASKLYVGEDGVLAFTTTSQYILFPRTSSYRAYCVANGVLKQLAHRDLIKDFLYSFVCYEKVEGANLREDMSVTMFSTDGTTLDIIHDVRLFDVIFCTSFYSRVSAAPLTTFSSQNDAGWTVYAAVSILVDVQNVPKGFCNFGGSSTNTRTMPDDTRVKLNFTDESNIFTMDKMRINQNMWVGALIRSV